MDHCNSRPYITFSVAHVKCKFIFHEEHCSKSIGPGGYRVGREDLLNRPKPYQRLGHSTIVLHELAQEATVLADAVNFSQ
jgi:hypothetical protein